METRALEADIVPKRSIDAPLDRVLVSVVVPAWNAAASIERALASVLQDPGLAVECIVVDDGSSDDTAARVTRVAAADPRIRLLRSVANEGVSSARNRGLAAATGEWLTFLDSDDRLLPGGLRAMLAAARPGDVRAVVAQRIWTDGRRTWLTAAYDRPDIRRPGRTSLAARPGLVYYASATGKLFHRSLVDGLRFEGRVLGDQPWTIRALIRAGEGIEVIGDVAYEWRRPRREAIGSTITAAKYASARPAAEAARVATGALAAVAAEVAASLPDPAVQARIVAAYFERLVSSDLAGPVIRAVARGDDGAAELFQAVGAFLAAAPPELVDRSEAVADGLIRRPIDRAVRLREPAWGSYLELVRALLRDHPGLASRVGRASLVQPILALLLANGSRSTPLRVRALLVLNWPLAMIHRWRRRTRRGFAPAGG